MEVPGINCKTSLFLRCCIRKCSQGRHKIRVFYDEEISICKKKQRKITTSDLKVENSKEKDLIPFSSNEENFDEYKKKITEEITWLCEVSSAMHTKDFWQLSWFQWLYQRMI